MKSIRTLIPDIYDLVKRKDGWLTDELAKNLSESIAKRLQRQYIPTDETQTARLRLSKMGQTCPRAFWYSVHHPELAEPLPPWAEIKFSYGHILEAFALTLAKASGHSVLGEQDELTLDGVVGHRDCVLDGYIVDVKSCSSRMFKKFEDKSIKENDMFGYLDQLDGYTVASANDPLVSGVDKAYILAVDKTLGHLCLYEHMVRDTQIRARVKTLTKVVQLDKPPNCTCKTVEDGRSGNKRLDVKASYSSFKHCCFPTLRTFLYSDGPVYLTEVRKIPNVPELFKRRTAEETSIQVH